MISIIWHNFKLFMPCIKFVIKHFLPRNLTRCKSILRVSITLLEHIWNPHTDAALIQTYPTPILFQPSEESDMMSREEGVDTFTLLHHDLNVCTNHVSELLGFATMNSEMGYFAHYEIYTWTLCHSYLHEKQTSRIPSLYLYFIKIVLFRLWNIRFLIQNTPSLFYWGHYSLLHRLMSLHGKMDVKFFLMFIVAENTRSVNIVTLIRIQHNSI